MTVQKALSCTGLSRHQYYYRPKGRRPGKKPTQTTRQQQAGGIVQVDNGQVLAHIRKQQSDPDTDYGYRKMCVALMLAGFYINHKKVYRLMREAMLLKPRYQRPDKSYARYRIVTPQGPLAVLEMDIKYVWVAQHRRHAYILTILDTFTRQALHWQVGYSMKAAQVKRAWQAVVVEHLQPADMLKKQIHIEVRNDNGPQFGAKTIRRFFEQNHLHQVFIHPYTPQENAHVESFNAILGKMLDKQVFWSFDELRQRLTLFYEKYNNQRLHGSIANLPPRLFRELWENGLIDRKTTKNKKIYFKLRIPYQQLSGMPSLREVPCLNFDGLNARNNLSDNIEVTGPDTLRQPSVHASPSVVPC